MKKRVIQFVTQRIKTWTSFLQEKKWIESVCNWSNLKKKRSSDFKFVLTLVYLNCYSRMLENISLNKV